MIDATKEVQGTAIYAEFSKGAGNTMMLLVTPDGYTTEGHLVESSVYRRVVTSYSPKRQWRNTRLVDHIAVGDTVGSGIEKVAYAENRLAGMRSVFESLISHGWALVKQPLFIEVSKRDLDDIRNRKTPSKIIYRINQSRKALSFPDPTATPVA